MARPCSSDHGGYHLALRRKLLLLLHLIELLRFTAAVILDRLGVVACHDEVLPGQPWSEAVDTDAMERLMEAAFWAPSPPVIKKRSFAATRHGRQRAALAGDGGADEEDDWSAAICTICLAEGQQMTELCNCSHAFHAACIHAWVSSSSEAATCPLCRTPVLPTAWDGWSESAVAAVPSRLGD